MTSIPDATELVCLVTCPNQDVAQELARQLVEERRAACVNIVPGVRSIYLWEGKLCNDAEVLCVIKTRAAAFERLRQRIAELHPYQVPEIIAIPIVAAHEPYLAWLRAAVDSDANSK